MSDVDTAARARPFSARAFHTVALVAGFGAMLGTILVFAPGSPLPEFDRTCARTWQAFDDEHPAFWQIVVLLTDFGGIAAMTLLTGMGALWQWSVGHRRLALAWIAIMIGGGALNQILKASLDRPRPPPEWRDRAVRETNESFPSGHSMSSTINYGMLAYALALGPPRRSRYRLAAVLLVGMVAGIGLSRAYLRAHWVSDVIGGFLFGLAWLCLWLGWLERRHRHDPAAALTNVDSG